MAGEAAGLVADALHQVAVRGDHPGAVIDQRSCRTAPPACARPAPCRPRWPSPGRAGRWWSRSPDARRYSGWPAAGECNWRNRLMSSIVMPVWPVRCSSAYSSIEPWPADSTKRSRSGQCGSAASNFRKRVHSAVATSAMPMGRPGWPDFGGLDRIDGKRADGVGHAAGWRGWVGQDGRLSGEGWVLDLELGWAGHWVPSGDVSRFGGYRGQPADRQVAGDWGSSGAGASPIWLATVSICQRRSVVGGFRG